jgi:type VI secretion system protein VasJ
MATPLEEITLTDPGVLSSLGINPIPGDNPSGTDIRLSDDYTAIQSEIDKLTSITGPGEGVNWGLIIELGTKILSQTSKDLTLAAYVGLAFQQTCQVTVLANVANFLADMMENFWDTLYPGLNRLRARVNAIDWWRGRTIIWLGKPGAPIPASDYEAISQSLRRLDDILGQKDMVSLAELISLSRQIPFQAPQEAPKSAPVAAESTVPSQRPEPPVGQPAPPKDLDEARTAILGQVGFYLDLAADQLWADPWYWKISRLNLWFNVKAAPPTEGTKTMLPAPPGDILTNLESMAKSENHAQALAFSEEQAKVYIFFLDLHIASFSALKALGFDASAEVVQSEAIFFTSRFPLLTSLTFDDGTPLASDATKVWLKSSIGGGAEETGPAPVEETIQDTIKGDPAQRLLNLSKTETRTKDGRSLFISRLAEARLWLNLGQKATALGLADHLAAKLGSHDLEDWEPELAALALKTSYNIYRTAGPASRDKAADMAVRLALLRPWEALALPPLDDA